MSRDAMRELKANTDVKNIVQRIYRAAVETARSYTETSYNHPLPPAHDLSRRVYVKNMPEILAGLQELFPGCDVSHTLLSKGTDGKMYDISKLDDKVLPFVNRALDQSYIVIDWS